ncbi:hypothetical protein NEMBOFW57_000539 [Staphylotrichum longicolle]|uniref:glycine--tRNA ligase n=1 Tax=Staphylotrichum longicolle TaxID=669026 RepID=A0AAD4I100_9PEZI|nr:hypothetical protein NEMBOFW57_000539 [Staphylotrichum longicolle]
MAPTVFTLKGVEVDRSVFDSLLKRRLFFTEAFEIYRLAPDYKGDKVSNIVDAWRRHFVLEENMLEVDCTVITPEQVLKTSAIVDKFAQMGILLRIDNYDETAQGQFLNFKKLLDYNQGAMPFASASVGKSYRNEISPRSGLLRVREFLMAEIEHYVDPEKKQHQRFSEVGDLILPLLDSETQLAGRNTPKNMAIKEAVTTRIIDNETLGYFLGRIMLFLLRIGIDPAKVRFRQHLSNEMAHYACDCWDAELLTSYGWIECVGCADCSAYDLTVHSKRTGTPLVVRETLPKPVEVTEWQATLTKSLAGPRFKRDAKTIQAALDSLDQSTLATLADELTEKGAVTVTTAPLSDGSTTTSLPASLVSITKTTRLRTTRSYTPTVIEPSFGIGRLLYALLEHVYWHRPDAPSRAVLSLPVPLAPVKVLIVPLSSSPHPQLTPLARALSARLRRLGIANNIDASSASIGRRYARNDELGTPFGVTVDFGSVEDGP